MPTTTKRQFHLDQPLPLGTIVERQVEGKTLFIDPEQPSWLALAGADAELFRRFASRSTLREILQEIPRPAVQHLVTRAIAAGFLGDRIADSYVRDVSRFDKRVQIHLTNRCNLRCTHCYMDSGVHLTPETEQRRWCELLSLIASRYSAFLSISGGEPLLSKALFPVLEHARALGMQTAIITNGLLLKGSTLERLKPLIDVCAVSLDGLSSATHDLIRGPGAFEKTYRNLLCLADVPFRVGLNITVLQTNKDELLRDLPAFLEGLPFQPDIDLGALTLEGRALSQPQLAVPADEFREIMTNLASRFVASHLTNQDHGPADGQLISRPGQTAGASVDRPWKSLPVRAKHSCGYGDTFAIYANGDLSPCLTPRFIRGNVFAGDPAELFDAIDREREAARVDRLEECKTCVLRHVCGGRCHLAQLRSGQAPSQVECPDSYKQSMFRKLAAWGASG